MCFQPVVSCVKMIFEDYLKPQDYKLVGYQMPLNLERTVPFSEQDLRLGFLFEKSGKDQLDKQRKLKNNSANVYLCLYSFRQKCQKRNLQSEKYIQLKTP